LFSNTHNIITNQRFGGKLIIFLFSPLIAFLLSFKDINSRESKLIIVLFFGFIGYTIVPEAGSDLHTTGLWYESLRQNGLAEVLNEFYISLSGQGYRGFELLTPMIMILAAVLGSGPELIYAAYGILYGIAFIRLISALYNNYRSFASTNLNALIFFIIIALFIPAIKVINGRYFLGYWFFIWSLYKIIIDADKRYIWLLILTPFIHQGLLISVSIYIVFWLTKYIEKYRNPIFYALILIALAYNSSGLEYARSALEYLGGATYDRASGYLSESYVEGRIRASQVKASWLMLYTSMQFFVALSIIFWLRFKKKLLFDARTNTLYSFFLLFLAFVIFVQDVPSIGSRTQLILTGLIFLLLYQINLYNYIPKLRFSTLLMVVSMAYYVIVAYRIDFGQLHPFVAVNNIFINDFLEADTGFWYYWFK